MESQKEILNYVIEKANEGGLYYMAKEAEDILMNREIPEEAYYTSLEERHRRGGRLLC